MHRYVPALFRRDGWEVQFVDVEDRERHSGRSKFTNTGRAVAGIPDLFGVAWLIHRRLKSRAREVEPASRTRAAE
jgi:dolichol-phosphate mannosyltransferase